MDNKITSNWIEDSYISTNVPEGRDGGLPMPLTPHELVQVHVAWEFCGMATFHALKFALRSGPVTLNMLSVGTCCRVYKVQ